MTFLEWMMPLMCLCAYVMGRLHGRLKHFERECEAYESGVKHGLEAGIMSGCAGSLTSKQAQRRGIVLQLN